MKDTITLYNIYRQYLLTTADLIELLEKHVEKGQTVVSPELKTKHKEFSLHAHNLIIAFNEDLHTLLRVNQELKGLENGS